MDATAQDIAEGRVPWGLPTSPEQAEIFALAAEERIQPAPTLDEREYWQMLANYYWSQA